MPDEVDGKPFLSLYDTPRLFEMRE
jgi:hypothetical protein